MEHVLLDKGGKRFNETSCGLNPEIRGITKCLDFTFILLESRYGKLQLARHYELMNSASSCDVLLGIGKHSQ